MKLNEVTEGWGDALKSVAGGFFQGATGIQPGVNANMKANYVKDFVRRINDKLRRAIGSGGVSTEPTATSTSTINTWDPTSRVLISGNTGMKYKRMSVDGDWQQMDPPHTPYPKDTKHATALDKAMNAIIAKDAHDAAGDMPDLAEAMYKKLNKIFESILTEGEVLSISDFLIRQLKIDVPSMTPAQEAYAKKITDSVQNAYAKPADFLAALNKLGEAVYSFVKK